VRPWTAINDRREYHFFFLLALRAVARAIATACF